MKFTIPGNPIAQGRPRFSRAGGFVRAYDPKKSVDYKSLIALFATERGVKQANGPIVVSIDLYFKRPKNLCRKRDAQEAIICHKRPDVDNCAKIFLDALNGIAWNDDGQVHSIRVTKWYHEKDGAPRADVLIEEIKGRG